MVKKVLRKSKKKKIPVIPLSHISQLYRSVITLSYTSQSINIPVPVVLSKIACCISNTAPLSNFYKYNFRHALELGPYFDKARDQLLCGVVSCVTVNRIVGHP